MLKRHVVRLAVVTVLAAGPQFAMAARYAVIDLGTLGGNYSVAAGINDDGQVVGDARAADGLYYPFIYDNGIMTALNVSADDYWAKDINNLGEVVGECDIAGGTVFRWKNGTVSNPKLGTTSWAHAINDSGRAVGSVVDEGEEGMEFHGFYWDVGSGSVNLPTLGGHVSAGSAYDINNSGQIVGSAAIVGGERRPCIWTGGVATDLGTLGGAWGTAFGVNGAGQVVGQSNTSVGSDEHAFFWDSGTMTDLGTLGGQHSRAEAVNDALQVVGYSRDAADDIRAFLWEAGTLHDLNDLIPPGSGWVLEIARDINDSGFIVGYGTSPSGEMHGFLLVPEPATLSLLALGGLALIRRRRTI